MSPSKLLQSEMHLGVLYQDLASRRYVFMTMQMVTPVLCLARCTGETLRHAMSHLLKPPSSCVLWQQLREVARMHVDATTCDSAKPNLRKEAWEAARGSANSFHFRAACYIHMLNTVINHSYFPITWDISGIIATSLASHETGATKALREAIADVVKSSLHIRKAPPPTTSSPDSRYRDQFLDFVLDGDSDCEARRKLELRLLLHSDITAEKMYFYSEDEVDTDALASNLASLLLPHAVSLIRRQRWFTSLQPLKEVLLCEGVHGIFHRAVPAWVQKMGQRPRKGKGKGKGGKKGRGKGRGRARRPGRGRGGDSVGEVGPWALSSSDADDSSDQDSDNGNQAQAAAPQEPSQIVQLSSQAWTEFNEEQRASCLNWALSEPGPHLLITTVVLKPIVRLMNKMEKVGSMEWSQNQQAEASRTGNRLMTRAEFMNAGSLTDTFFQFAADLFDKHNPVWLLLPSAWRTEPLHR